MKDKKWINKYFSEDELIEIQSKLNDIEQNTNGEIILSLRNEKSFLEKLYTAHELAWKDFNRLGVANTKERTGVLIFIIFEEKYYDIIADEGIFKKITNETWDKMEENLKAEFKKSNYFTGLLNLIKNMEEVLCREFPCRADSVNDDELDSEIVIN
jgi:uncharacterized membrane protein